MLVSNPLTYVLALGLNLSAVLMTPISKILFVCFAAVSITYLVMLGIIFRFIVACNNKDMGWFGSLNSCIRTVVKSCREFLTGLRGGLVWCLECSNDNRNGNGNVQAETSSQANPPPHPSGTPAHGPPTPHSTIAITKNLNPIPAHPLRPLATVHKDAEAETDVEDVWVGILEAVEAAEANCSSGQCLNLFIFCHFQALSYPLTHPDYAWKYHNCYAFV